MPHFCIRYTTVQIPINQFAIKHVLLVIGNLETTNQLTDYLVKVHSTNKKDVNYVASCIRYSMFIFKYYTLKIFHFSAAISSNF